MHVYVWVCMYARMYVCVCVCMNRYAQEYRCPERLEKGIKFSGAWVKGICELPSMAARNHLTPVFMIE